MNVTSPPGSTGKLVGAFLSFIVVFIGELAGYLLAIPTGINPNVSTTGGGAIAAIAMVALMGGGRWLRPTWKGIRDAFAYMWWILVVTVVLMVWAIVSYVGEGAEVVPDWPVHVLESLVLCLFIGIAEEGEFRGLMYGGLLAKGGGSRRALMVVSIVTAILFGMAHIEWGGLDWANPYSLAQALLKVAQTGMYSVMLSAVVLKTHSLVGVMLFHAIDDWLLFVVGSGFFNEGYETEYVTTASSEEAIESIVFYVIICLLYLPTFLKALRTLRSDVELPEWGPFMTGAAPVDAPVSVVAPNALAVAGPATAPGPGIPGDGVAEGAMPQPWADGQAQPWPGADFGVEQGRPWPQARAMQPQGVEQPAYPQQQGYAQQPAYPQPQVETQLAYPQPMQQGIPAYQQQGANPQYPTDPQSAPQGGAYPQPLAPHNPEVTTGHPSYGPTHPSAPGRPSVAGAPAPPDGFPS